MNKKNVSAWSETNIVLIDATTRASSNNPKTMALSAKAAVWELEDGNHPKVPVVAFCSPRSRLAFAGPASDFYVENDSEIFGLTMYGAIGFTDGMGPPAAKRVEDAISLFEKDFGDHKWTILELIEARGRQGIPLYPFMHLDFTTAHPGSSQVGTSKITGISGAPGTVKLDLLSPAGDRKGELWIDARTRFPFRATVDGQIVFPTEERNTAIK